MLHCRSSVCVVVDDRTYTAMFCPWPLVTGLRAAVVHEDVTVELLLGDKLEPFKFMWIGEVRFLDQRDVVLAKEMMDW